MNAKISFIFTFLFSLSSVADFTGTWRGQGQTGGDSKTTLPCENMEFTFLQTTTSLTFSGQITCSKKSESMPELTYEIRRNELWLNQQKVGSIADDYIYLESPENSNSMKEQLYFSLNKDQTLEYQHYLMDESGGYILISLNGILKKL